MTRYQFELAKRTDDAGLRRLMAGTPMLGDVTLTFEREPNFFRGNRVYGRDCQTIVCRDQEYGEIVGAGTRSSRLLYVDGIPTRIGYLGGLRFASRVRGAGLLARGFRFLKDLHDAQADPPAFYLTTIAEGNEAAERALTTGRAGLPFYHPLGSLSTFALAKRRLRRMHVEMDSAANDKLIVCSLAELPDFDAWLAFLNEINARRAFSPVYEPSDFDARTGTFLDLDFKSIVVIRRDDRIVATAGIWNQSSFRQTVVRNYRMPIRLTRPLLNAAALLTGSVTMPPIGKAISAAYVSSLAVRDDNRFLMRRLLHELAERCAPQNLLLGLCDRDPLLASCWILSRLRYRTNLYAVNWDPPSRFPVDQSTKPFYLELGCL